jgi:outer membrane cobalamin receptor
VSAAGLDWRWSAQVAGDELVRSTDLVGGTFDQRRYVRASLAPGMTWQRPGGAALTLRGGLTADYSDRDEDAVLPLVELAWSRSRGTTTDRLALEYAATSQVPGYTALKSPPTGLFGGNPDLGRSRADTLAITVTRDAAAWFGRATGFLRQDDDLVDWTYRAAAPFVRQANAVDVDVAGFEAELGRRWDRLELSGGYTFLHKDEDYGRATVDASYYALNYAEQRLTLAVRYRPFEWLDVRLDNRLSRNRENALRTSDRDACQMALTIGWLTPLDGLRVDFAADNLTDEDFQSFPGTPAPRRQFSVRTQYAW